MVRRVARSSSGPRYHAGMKPVPLALAASLASWDRGFDEAGVQVWGATEGPYVFDRLSDEAPR